MNFQTRSNPEKMRKKRCGMRKKLWIGIAAVLAGFCLLSIIIFVICKGSSARQNAKTGGVKKRTEKPQDGPPSIWIMGDSLAAENGRLSKGQGWGSMLQKFLKSDVTVRNAAVKGASSSSYAETATYKMAMQDLADGDYVLIQFGHNDAWIEDCRTDPYGDSDTKGSFAYVLKNKYIKPILKKGGHVILVTSVVCPMFESEGKLYPMVYADHAQAMRNLSEECREEGLDVALIDLYSRTEAFYERIGEERALQLHIDDLIHYSVSGANYAAGIIVEEMKKMGIPCLKDSKTLEEIIQEEDLQGLEEWSG